MAALPFFCANNPTIVIGVFQKMQKLLSDMAEIFLDAEDLARHVCRAVDRILSSDAEKTDMEYTSI
jgi:hypothetical protein